MSKMIRNRPACILFIGALAALIMCPLCLNSTPAAAAQDKPSPTDPSQSRPQVQELMKEISQAFESAAAKVSPSVVSIFAEQVIQVQSPFGTPEDPFRDFFGDEFFRRFFGESPQKKEKQTVRSLGSGVIVSRDGFILTNNHVVEKAAKLSVVIGDKKTYAARVVGTDPQTDVAVIRIDAKDLPVATLGNSDEVRVGQWVIAVGNPFQLMRTVTAGIISAKGRSSVGLAAYEDFIQTDASINPGNSGGALADLEGRVIGINTAITSPSGGNIGIGFAIPANMARQVMDQLRAKGRVIRGYVGLYPQNIDEDLAQALKLKGTEGALIGDVVPGGPADRAGIKRGDVIVAFNGRKIEDSTQLRNLVAQTPPHTVATFTLLRDGQTIEVNITLAEMPRERSGRAPQAEQPPEPTSQKLGLSLQDLTPDLANQLGYKDKKGVVVAEVAPASPADDAGLQPGDLIMEVNRKPVRTTQDFNLAVRGLKSGDVVSLLVARGETTSFRALKVQ